MPARPPLAPGPPANLLVGHLGLALTDHISSSWAKVHASHGDTFGLRMGPPGVGYRLTVTRDPESIGYVLGATSPFDKENHPFFEAFRDLLGGFDQMALRLLSAVNEHQALMVTRSGNHLTRLVGLSRLHQQFAAAADVGA